MCNFYLFLYSITLPASASILVASYVLLPLLFHVLNIVVATRWQLPLFVRFLVNCGGHLLATSTWFNRRYRDRMRSSTVNNLDDLVAVPSAVLSFVNRGGHSLATSTLVLVSFAIQSVGGLLQATSAALVRFHCKNPLLWWCRFQPGFVNSIQFARIILFVVCGGVL